LDFSQYIQPGLLILVPALVALGQMIKKAGLKSKLVPVVLGVVGIVLAAFWTIGAGVFYTAQDVIMGGFVGIVQGLLCAGAAVYAHQLVKQAGKED
jgi:hypothetical protein